MTWKPLQIIKLVVVRVEGGTFVEKTIEARLMNYAQSSAHAAPRISAACKGLQYHTSSRETIRTAGRSSRRSSGFALAEFLRLPPRSISAAHVDQCPHDGCGPCYRENRRHI